ncbi:MAG: DNA polymerase III subunit chi [Candidatus Endonucleobacter bathymodioli]|uniref:DNA polymerase III subunit chi n=1 Tax=Candidatus Endonucleibacter bathymodioli TaxID=539814 RepID=A0AA90NR67_9GAMM|nr:DNA polymerase III subunit chi [Candidatus Endonucleobacter bathymodioli]
MPQVTFYKLISSDLTPEEFACRLSNKAWHNDWTTHIHTLDEQACQHFDKLLWEWRDYSFIPHLIHHPKDAFVNHGTIVTIGCDNPPQEQQDMLINLAPSLPPFYNQFNKVCEIVANIHDNDSINVSRNKFRQYREAGIKPETYPIGTT